MGREAAMAAAIEVAILCSIDKAILYKRVESRNPSDRYRPREGRRE